MKYELKNIFKDLIIGIFIIIFYRISVKKIKNSVIKKLVITDTIDNKDKTKSAKNIEVLSISALMGKAIKIISN